MFRFSCFHSPLNSQKSKKTVQLCTESMQKTLEDYPAQRPEKDSNLSKVPECVGSGDTTNPSSSSVVHDSKSEGFESVNDANGARNVCRMTKSVSLGSGLVRYNGISSGDESSSPRNDCSDPGRPEDPKDPVSNSREPSSNAVNHESANQDSVFSLEYTKRSENDVCESPENRFSEDGTRDSRTAIVKSKSLPFLRSRGNLVHQSRSSQDLKSLVSRRKDSSTDENEVDFDKINDENPADDGFDAYDYMGSAKDWIVPAADELGKGKEVQEDHSVLRWEDLPSKEFKIKRIEKWVMDLRHCSSLEETDGAADFDGQGGNGKIDVAAASRTDSKAVLGTEAVKRYISSLSGSATAAQLANLGLVAIPLMSAFVSLKALNLSGNAIVRITAGALPRGLHVLNLSKNSIATIEGLRELTRLRVLDLSYNRILRIGHGLASCSSLKELYLAGNKISEVEGLHRLLKLTVLDLRFNKLATTKGLGQLAANYNSLQAVSLEGNPAQKNMGDEPLKKYLVGLLPHLAYFNRQPIKDSADRAGRLVISAHQADNRGGSRAELKNVGKSRKGQAAVHGRLPPSGVKVDRAVHGRDLSSKLRSFRPDLASMRRAHSEGLLRAV